MEKVLVQVNQMVSSAFSFSLIPPEIQNIYLSEVNVYDFPYI